jgi:predicted permease
MWRDLRYAVVTLLRTPIFTLAATLALGLAIGANATIFGLVDGLWFRPPGVRQPETLVRVFSKTDRSARQLWSYPEFTDIGERIQSLDGAVALGRRGAAVRGDDGTTTLLLANVVSMNFFTVLGVTPAHGRLFAPGDESAIQAQPAVVLGHAFWRRHFGGDPSIVGRTMPLDRGRPLAVTVLGVLPERFRDVDAAGDRDLWMPVETWAHLVNPDDFRFDFERRDSRWFEIFGRRREGVATDTVTSELAVLASSLAATYPDLNAGRGAWAQSDFNYRLENGGANAMALLGLVLLVVAITCVNLANLLLARGAARSREIAVRVALGAGRWRVLRQLMIESAILGLFGVIAGMTIALWLIRLLPAVLVPAPGMTSYLLFQADGRVFAFTLVVSLVTTLLFGVIPSWIAAGADAAPVMRGTVGTEAAAPKARAGRNALVVVQVAVSLVLLSAAGLLVRSFLEAAHADLGFARKPLLTAWVTGSNAPVALWGEAVSRLQALPGVTRVAVAVRAPLSLSGQGLAFPVTIDGIPHDPAKGVPAVRFNAVSASYFATMGTRVIRGRTFEPADERGGELTVVVSEQFAKHFFGDADPIGRVARIGRDGGADHRIIGVVQDATVISQLGEAVAPYMYLPYWRGRYGEITYLLETSVPAADLTSQVRAELKAVDAGLEPRRVIAMSDYIAYAGSTYQATAALALALGVLGLLLTAIGVYGVIAYRTSRRTREIGIRIALGAARHDVLALVLGHGLRIALLGIVVGLPAGLWVTSFMSSLLFGVEPWDVLVFALAASVLAATVAAATFIPAWRATRVTPSVALRDA